MHNKMLLFYLIIVKIPTEQPAVMTREYLDANHAPEKCIDTRATSCVSRH